MQPIASIRKWLAAHPVVVTFGCTAGVTAALVYGLWGKRDAFASAIGSAPAITLALAIGLQIVWLIARSEAWHVCVEAAGGNVERRRLYRASSIGYLGNLFNSSFGAGVRIAALRRSAPERCPNVSVLIAAELPIVIAEMALAAIFAFTLVEPLGLAWWAPVLFFAAAVAVIVVVSRVARQRTQGFWSGFAVMRGMRDRSTIIGLVCFATGAQVVRNWVVLHGLGVDVSVLDSVALLIAAAVFGLLPVGPTLGVATSVVILGSNGVAVTAAAGALLTATGAIGALCFAAWGLLDGRFRPHAPSPPASAPAPSPSTPPRGTPVADPL
jgi:uncharacterized membrane protein YbhN (UPF0104 family)